MLTDVIVIVLLVGGCVGFGLWGWAHPEAGRQLGPYLPYVWIFLTLDMAYLCFRAHDRKAWWWVTPLFCLVMTIHAFVRQRRIRRAGR